MSLENIETIKFDNRYKSMLSLTQLLENTGHNLVMSISSPWGTGKTTFKSLWKKYLEYEKKDQFIVFDYNAWEYDYFEDPILSFLSCIERQVDNIE